MMLTKRILSQTGRFTVFSRTSRKFSISETRNVKVAVVGAAGGIGQPMSLLLKLSPMVTELRLYDIKNMPGVTADLSHLETPAKCFGFNGPAQIKDCFKGADIIMVPAGVPRKPGMTRDDLFASNASVVKEIATAAADVAPNASIGIITNPVNACVPIVCKTMEKLGKLNPNKIFGISTLDIVRSNTFVAELKGLNPMDVKVPVIGGHAGTTIIPLISQASPKVDFPQDVIEKLTKRIQNAGTEVMIAFRGQQNPCLTKAYSGMRFCNALMRAIKGEPHIIECAYVMSDVTEVKYFATPLLLGKNGIKKNLGIPKGISAYEQKLVQQSFVTLRHSIEMGEEYAMKDEVKEKKNEVS